MARYDPFTLVLLLCSLSQSAASELYHISVDATLCTVPCLTFSQFALLHSSHHLDSNTTLLFLPGRHYLNVNLTLYNANSFSMTSKSSTAQIECASYSHMHFNHSRSVHIANLEFIGCGGNQVENSVKFVLEHTLFQGQEESGTALDLIDTTAQIVNTSIVSYMKGTFVQTFYQSRCGGAIIARHSNIDIKYCTFESNGAARGGVVYAENSSMINMSNNTFVNNIATDSGGVVYSSKSAVTIEASQFDNNTANSGGVIYSLSGNVSIIGSDFDENSAVSGVVVYSYRGNVTIVTSEFVDNHATGNGNGLVFVYYCKVNVQTSKFRDNSARSGLISSHRSTIKLKRNVFDNNTAVFGAAVYSRDSNISVEESRFEHNTATLKGILCCYNGVITVETSKFYNNDGGYSGILYFYGSNVKLSNSDFSNNFAERGGVIYSYSSNIAAVTSKFQHNDAYYGGVVYSQQSNITMEASEFENNFAQDGGVLRLLYCKSVRIAESKFYHNSGLGGGVVLSRNTNITIRGSEFNNNLANYGGVVYSLNSEIKIETSEFDGNRAKLNIKYLYLDGTNPTVIRSPSDNERQPPKNGGVVYSRESNITIREANFNDNSAVNEGGVLYSVESTITIDGANFTNNNSSMGAVINARKTKINQLKSLKIADNSAGKYAIVFLADSVFYEYQLGTLTFSSNLGSLMAFNSSVVFAGYSRFVNNTQPVTATGSFQEGGAMTLFQSSLFLYGTCHFEHNLAENGGAIFSSTSKFYVNSDVNIAHNRATGNGGGVYLLSSELTCHQNSKFTLFSNAASNKGGGIHTVSAEIKTVSSTEWRHPSYQYSGARLNFTENTAKKGGGLSLEANAKLYILKYTLIYDHLEIDTNTAIFTANSADHGGAVYVDDYTNSGMCASALKAECFFQVLAIYGEKADYIKTQSIHFSQNNASISGGTLYGGLLDRCALNPLAEVLYKNWTRWEESGDDGVAYLDDVSISTNTSISSHPVKVSLCDNYPHINVKKGEGFTVSLVANDQIGHPVSGTIQTSLNFSGSGLAEGQLTRTIPGECTNLTFNVVSPNSSEKLTLYASDGPCKDVELSTAKIEIHFLPCNCPIGLQISGNNKTNCSCECHADVSQYMEQCDSHTGVLIKSSQSRAWIAYVNNTNVTGYLAYPNCPFDYCNSQRQPINLNQRNGADAQCAFNRSSLLCGSCQAGLSLSLASSRCLSCPSHWPALLIAVTIAAVLAGIALVALLLFLNMTVAVGTLNGLIFYANVVYANKNILLQFEDTNFVTVYISWLNLDIGIDTCYFPGMDTYTKTWLQLVFPAYVILLVVLVIIISSYSTKFSNFIGRKDPVATLATLILLSYAKLLEICFKSLSVGILEYPDGSSQRLWLPDANIKYFSGKHIPLFITAVIILLIGLVYTVLLFSWQWLLFLPKWRVFNWTRNQKLQTFIETYTTPYTPKHRYWTGLLLFVRVALYLVATVNVSNDPHVLLTAIVFTVCFVVFLGKFSGTRVYRKWPVDILDTFFYLNILFFALFTLYCLGDRESNQKVIAYVSVSITIGVLLLIILHHVYTYTSIFSKVKQTKAGRKLDGFLTQTTQPKPKPKRQSPPPDDDIHRFHEVLDMIDHRVNTADYNVPQRQHAAAPTHTVVDVIEPRADLNKPNTAAAITTETEEQDVECSTDQTQV